MARPARQERRRSARSSCQPSRFCCLINSDMVFGTHREVMTTISTNHQASRCRDWNRCGICGRAPVSTRLRQERSPLKERSTVSRFLDKAKTVFPYNRKYSEVVGMSLRCPIGDIGPAYGLQQLGIAQKRDTGGSAQRGLPKFDPSGEFP